MASISNLGVGSGLDLTTLYNNLEAAENTKLTTITNQKTTYTAQLSAYGKLQSALTSLQTATAALGKAATWNSTTVNSTNTSFSTATTSDATVGNYTVNVSQVAKAQVLMSSSIASNTTQLGGTTTDNTRTITQPGTKTPLTVKLSDSETSLTGIANAINKANGNVTATVMKATDGDYRLMLTSKSTGTDYDMTVTVTGDDTLQQKIGHDSSTTALTVQTQSQNAKLSINNVAIERASNTITDALPGVTLTLKSKSTADETLSIGRATDANTTAINNWVTAYNSLQSTIASVTKYVAVDAGADSQSSSNGALLGDSNVRSIQSQLRSLLTDVQSQSGNYKILAQLGITQNPVTGSDGSTGTLTVDSTKLSKALTDNPDLVQAYFIGDGSKTGLATKMNNTLTSMLSTATGKTGVIQNAQDGINKTIKTLDQRYTDMEATIEATMARYKAQFTALDTMVSKLNSTATYLTQQFSSRS